MSRSLFSGILFIGGRKVISIIIAMIFTPILVRLLGPTEYGRYGVILSIFAFANILVTSGTNDGVRKFISEKNDREWKEGVFGYLARPAALLAILGAMAFVAGAYTGFVEQTLGPEYTVPFYLLALYTMGRQFREYLGRSLMGLQLENWSEPLEVLRKLFFMSLALIAVYYGYSVEGILVADIITSLLIGLLSLVVLSRYINIQSLVNPPSVSLTITDVGSYVGSTVVFFGLLMSLYHIDVLFLQYYYAEEIVGYYKGALSIAEVLWFVPQAIQLALLQRVSDLWKKEDYEAIQSQAKTINQHVLLFTLLVAIGMAALAADFVPIYLGADFQQSVLPLVLLLPGVLGFAAARPTLAINQGRRSLRPLIISTAACALVNILLNAALVPRYEMIGAAVATSIGYGSLTLFQSLAARHIGYSPFEGVPLKRIAATGAIAAVPIFGLTSIIESSILALVIVPPIGFVTFSVAAFITGAVNFQDIHPLTSRITKFMRIFYL